MKTAEKAAQSTRAIAKLVGDAQNDGAADDLMGIFGKKMLQ